MGQAGRGDIIQVLSNGLKKYIEVKSSPSAITKKVLEQELPEMVRNANAAEDVFEVVLKIKSGTLNPATRKTIEEMGIIIIGG